MSNSNVLKLGTVLTSLLITTSMNAQTLKNPSTLFDPSPYAFSHVATIPTDTKLVFIAGQGGEENTDGKLTADFRSQVQFSLKNIKSALAESSLEMDNIVKVTTLVVDHDKHKLDIIIEEFNKVWPKKNFPVNTLIPVPRLAIDGMMVEIDATAMSKK